MLMSASGRENSGAWSPAVNIRISPLVIVLAECRLRTWPVNRRIQKILQPDNMSRSRASRALRPAIENARQTCPCGRPAGAMQVAAPAVERVPPPAAHQHQGPPYQGLRRRWLPRTGRNTRHGTPLRRRQGQVGTIAPGQQRAARRLSRSLRLAASDHGRRPEILAVHRRSARGRLLRPRSMNSECAALAGSTRTPRRTATKPARLPERQQGQIDPVGATEQIETPVRRPGRNRLPAGCGRCRCAAACGCTAMRWIRNGQLQRRSSPACTASDCGSRWPRGRRSPDSTRPAMARRTHPRPRPARRRPRSPRACQPQVHVRIVQQLSQIRGPGLVVRIDQQAEGLAQQGFVVRQCRRLASSINLQRPGLLDTGKLRIEQKRGVQQGLQRVVLVASAPAPTGAGRATAAWPAAAAT